jgi:hypothetical protein
VSPFALRAATTQRQRDRFLVDTASPACLHHSSGLRFIEWCYLYADWWHEHGVVHRNPDAIGDGAGSAFSTMLARPTIRRSARRTSSSLCRSGRRLGSEGTMTARFALAVTFVQ